MTKSYILTRKELEALIDSHLRLAALNYGGVNNWNYYCDALNDYIKSHGYDPIEDEDAFSHMVNDYIDNHHYFTIEL